MTDFTTELRNEADSAMTDARDAASRERAVHARAELMRHMMLTTAKSTHELRATSVRLVVDEWLDAWRRTRADYPYVAQMEALSAACYDALTRPGDDTDRAVRQAFRALDDACVARGSTIADEMAWRSGCSHRWWGEIRPAPDDDQYREQARPTESLWQRGCPPECLG